jgi:hypothetical protein
MTAQQTAKSPEAACFLTNFSLFEVQGLTKQKKTRIACLGAVYLLQVTGSMYAG